VSVEKRFRMGSMLSMYRTVAVMLMLAGLSACYDPHAQESQVIRLLEANGAGDLNTYSAPGLQQWFSTRPKLAQQVAQLCDPISKNSAANWATSAEGTACSAAVRTRAFSFDPTSIKADTKLGD
jgi:hypothetical protein